MDMGKGGLVAHGVWATLRVRSEPEQQQAAMLLAHPLPPLSALRAAIAAFPLSCLNHSFTDWSVCAHVHAPTHPCM